MAPSIRRRLLIVTLSVFSLGWVATTIVSYIDSRRDTEHLLDAQLEQVARIVMTMSEHELEEELIARGDDTANTLEMYDRSGIRDQFGLRLAFQVWINGERLALRSKNSPAVPLSNLANGFNSTVVNYEPWRVYSITEPRTLITVYVGEHDSIREDLIASAAIRAIAPLLIVAPIIGLLTWWGVGRALRPLHAVAGTVARRNPRDLSPISDSSIPEETQPVVQSVNRLLAQLSTAFEGAKRFTADAAHELRTPLAGIAAQTEVALLTTDESVRSGALSSIKTATKKMSRLVQQLLTLARWDANLANVQRVPLMLNVLAEEIVRELEGAATSGNVRLSCEVISEPVMFGDETSVQMIIRNIVDNAIRYTPAGGTVRIEIDSTPEHAVLRVVDTGPGLSAEDRDRIFQRFYRGGRHDTTGSGLGLSIVRQCVDLHGGTIDIESPDVGGLIVTVNLPKRVANGPQDTLVLNDTKRSDVA